MDDLFCLTDDPFSNNFPLNSWDLTRNENEIACSYDL